ncbi:MAGa3780 family membrane protein [Mycoplasma sp. 480]|uniref:MAGa3780 family membrane protein n=1 Tax=Mycoplasma sp. 480 TaxID=3440155 RepID=UPI003F50D961
MKKHYLKNMISNKGLPFTIMGLFILLTSLIFIIIDMVQFSPSTAEVGKAIKMQVIFKNASSLIYFTYQSNFLLGIVLLFLAASPKSHKLKRWLFAATTLITITFIIYWALISYTNDWTKVYESTVSLITHLINPILGFVALFLIRKTFTIDNKLLFLASLYVFGYFLFALILYFSSYAYYAKEYNDGIVIYTFLNFTKPFFYKGGNIAVVIFLDILMFIIALFIPMTLGLFWKAVYRITYNKNNCYLKDLKRKIKDKSYKTNN